MQLTVMVQGGASYLQRCEVGKDELGQFMVYGRYLQL
jgi:hypothetical protein